MRINVAVPEEQVTAPVLDASLEAVTRLNEQLISEGKVPLFDEVRDHIRWKPEPPGDEHFDHAGVVLGRKWGDCDDMAPFAAASMRASGEDPGATAVVRRSGPKRWHAVVELSDGTIRDPSRETGMGQPAGVRGAGLPAMGLGPSSAVVGSYIMRPQLALRPITDTLGHPEAWQARADLPWHWLPGNSPADIAMAALHASPVSSEAIVGACDGIVALGEANDVDDEVLNRARAIAELCEGADWHDLAEMYGPEDATAAGQLVGSFLGKFGRSIGRFVKHINPVALLEKGIQFIPGIGPVASSALHAASPALQHLLARGHHLPPAAHAPPGVPHYGTPMPSGGGGPAPMRGSPLAELRIFR